MMLYPSRFFITALILALALVEGKKDVGILFKATSPWELMFGQTPYPRTLIRMALPNWSTGRLQQNFCPHQNIIELRGGGSSTKSTSNKKESLVKKASAEKSSTSSAAITEGWKNSLASGLASVCAKVLLQPFDTIKTVQQHSPETLSLLQAIQSVLNRPGGAGWKDLYAGVVVSALGSIPSISLYYGIYSYCKRVLFVWMLEARKNETTKCNNGYSDRTLKLLAVGMAAATGNTIASFSRVPYEVVKQKLQTGQYSNTIDAIASLFRDSGFFRSLFPPGAVAIQMLRDVPYAIVTLLVYEYLRDVWKAEDSNRQVVWRDMTIGALAGGTGSFVTNGFDVLKTRLQTSPPELYGGSILTCARMTFQEGGIRIFLRGSTSRLIHKMPANAFFFYFYEFFRTLLKVDRTKLNEQQSSSKGKR